ncbi:hypothetical protein [uncultured Draconibacterium sp.]|uniref:hypothetical protein n=1 Tax=uncultured Draconibacterium sp. TaxID=1573823 RepID=UPI002AA6D3A2|nr:hypothetical protein [uncultured Draconibacterium sp.]
MRYDIDIERSWRQLHHFTAVNAVPSSLQEEKQTHYEHFSSWLGGVLPVKSGGRWLSDEMNSAIIGATFPTWGEMSAGQRGSEALTPPHRCKRGPLRLKGGEAGACGDGVDIKTNKNAHHFQKETVSKRDNNLSLVFLISSREEQWSGLVNLYEMNYCDKGDRPPLSPEGGNFLPFGEVRRRRFPKSSSISEDCLNPLVLQGQSGLVANKIKSSAYET